MEVKIISVTNMLKCSFCNKLFEFGSKEICEKGLMNPSPYHQHLLVYGNPIRLEDYI
ncbi:MAG: hypothetical protein HeimC3_26080 [Candidatus Heimdallarchaeota archaeon LC_3]|nr:MAG: hypothetical protein HeimC3_26080 [Candidatus Heimdallarchaeota archaeon LC_3]